MVLHNNAIGKGNKEEIKSKLEKKEQLSVIIMKEMQGQRFCG